jgi:hypothetical protein
VDRSPAGGVAFSRAVLKAEKGIIALPARLVACMLEKSNTALFPPTILFAAFQELATFQA